MYIMIIRGQK